MLRCGGAWGTGKICRRRCNRYPCLMDNRSCYRVSWNTDCYRFQSSRSFQWDNILFRQNDRQRSRTKMPAQLIINRRDVFSITFCLGSILDMDNQWIILRTSLCQKDIFYRIRIQGIGTQTINRFGRKCDQSALTDDLSCTDDRFPVLSHFLYS